jgi:hypothetical protein
MCYDAVLVGELASLSRYRFLLCDERFQPHQPRQELSLIRLIERSGCKSKQDSQTADVRLAQDWQSAPGGPVHAQGTRLGEVGVETQTAGML